MPVRRSPQHTSVSAVPAGPVRTCVGCRARDSRSSLLRVVLVIDATGSPVLVPDEAARLPGRGAWLHPDPDCLALAQRRKAFGRALRHAGPLDVTVLATTVLAEAVARAQDGQVARRSGTPGPKSNKEAG
ncbi:MAG: YlxR family protein [Micrococcales bacterium]|nr:YlxR family protein [Micrococcales bacterium]